MPQPTDRSPSAVMAARLYPDPNASQEEDTEGDGGDLRDDQQDPQSAINVQNFDGIFNDIGRLQKQKDYGRAEIAANGGRVATNLLDFKPGEKGYFGSLCAMRWSNAMTKNGNPLNKDDLENSGARSISDKNDNKYIWTVREAKQYLDSAMNNGVDVIGNLDAIQGRKGFLVIDHPEVMGKKIKVPISGHVTAWDGQRTADNSDNFMKGAKHIYFYEVPDANSN